MTRAESADHRSAVHRQIPVFNKRTLACEQALIHHENVWPDLAKQDPFIILNLFALQSHSGARGARRTAAFFASRLSRA